MSEREVKLMDQIDFDISEVVRKIKGSADGKPITTLKSPTISNEAFNHGFTTRFGGVSTHETLSSLNLMFNPKRRDPLNNVLENRQRLALACRFMVHPFNMAKCVHGAGVWVIGDEEPDSYDALVSNQPFVNIAAPGADCTILLFSDPINKVYTRFTSIPHVPHIRVRYPIRVLDKQEYAPPKIHKFRKF